MKTKLNSAHTWLLATTSVVEMATGLALIVAPSFVAELLLGSPLITGTGLSVGRVAGAALMSFASACWSAREFTTANGVKPLVGAMTFYNIAVLAVLCQSRLLLGTAGFAFWPAIFVHLLMGYWCVRSWMSPAFPPAAR